ncbi:hypothetical protein CR51_27385 [Caballeronia megalochromosomata]|nr:hypothetical protein CR51_27385 [Caballeronia megalochromosomata]
MPRSRKALATAAQIGATARVYSYLRFSDIRQKAGTSVERQEEYAVKWAREHAMELDTNLTLRDEGLSAFHQKHVTQGALGVFLKAVNDGTVPAGSVLIVESLDRLSRADPIIAQSQLNSIVIAGVEVVTASDGMRYSLKTVKENSGILFMALGVMLRANEESATKSKRVRAAAHKRCQNWIDGKSRERIAVGKNPGWVEFDEKANEFRLVPEFVTPLMALVGYFRAGYSLRRCFDQLHAAGIPLPPEKADKYGKVKHGGMSNTTRLYEIIQNRALVGEKVVEIDGTEYPLPDYYPPLMTEAEFAELQYLRKQRGRVVGTKSEIVSFLTGMRLTYCTKCGRAMANQNMMNRSRRDDGLPQDGHRRLYCTGRTFSNTDRCTAPSVSIVPVERAVMDFCSDQMNLTSLFAEQHDKTRNLNGQLALARAQVAKTEAALKRFFEMMEVAGDDTPTMLLSQMRSLQRRLEGEETRVANVEFELAALHRNSTPAMAEIWAALRDGVVQLDPAARIKARQLVADTFKSIEIEKVTWHGDELIYLRLTSKRGVIRQLHVDRKTGERRDIVVETDQTLKPRRKPAKTRNASEPATAV